MYGCTLGPGVDAFHEEVDGPGVHGVDGVGGSERRSPYQESGPTGEHLSQYGDLGFGPQLVEGSLTESMRGSRPSEEADHKARGGLDLGMPR